MKKIPPYGIKSWATDDRPREKLLQKGVMALSDSELLAILINSGNHKESALDIARAALQLAGNNLSELGRQSIAELEKTRGIGKAKAILIVAALELGRRQQASKALEKQSIHNSKDLADFIQSKIKDFTYEVFAILLLNRANKINHFELISKGGLTATVADPRLILKSAIEKNATSIILCHNHPSGNLTPSQQDIRITTNITEAAKYFDIRVLDHIIVSDEGYFSFADQGMI